MAENNQYILGLYDDEEVLLEAVKKIREKGINIYDVFTPFPVHGLDEALGLSDTRIPKAGFIIGAVTAVLCVLIMGWITAIDYPLNVGGKPVFPLPSFIPPTFEGTVLLTSIGMAAIMFTVSWLVPSPNAHPFEPRATDDKFVIAIKKSSSLDIQKVKKVLKESGASETKEKVVST